MENECEALPGVAYPGVRDNRSTINTKTGYDDDDAIELDWMLSDSVPYRPGSSYAVQQTSQSGSVLCCFAFSCVWSTRL